MTFDDVTFAVIAGGQGRRLGGCVKGLLERDGEPVVARLLALGRGCRDRFIVSNDSLSYGRWGVPVHADVEPGRGAPGGLVTALLQASTPWVLVCACDMPFVSAPAVTALLELAATDPHADVACFERNGQPEPLFALYRQTLAHTWRPQLPLNRSLRQWLGGVKCVQTSAPDPHWLDSVNVGEDLIRWGLVRKF